MSRAPLLLVILALLAACGAPLRMDGGSVHEQYGRLVVDDVALEFRREVPVQGVLGATARASGVSLGTHTGAIDLAGGPGDTYEFVVLLETELEGDGEVQLVDGVLRVRSIDGGKCVINGVRGRLPEGVGLDLLSGTGSVTLAGFTGGQTVRVESGVGEVHLETLGVAGVELRSGTGLVRLDGLKSPRVDVELGTGVLLASGCELGALRAESGTGDFVLTNCRVQEGRFHSGTGNLHLRGSHVGALERSLGTGDVLHTAAPAPEDG